MRLQTFSAAALGAAFLIGAPAVVAHPGHETEPAKAAAADAATDHDSHCGMPMGEGVINALDVKAAKATIAHGPISAIGWDTKMTMTFGVAKPVDLSAFAAGDKVHFLLKPEKDKKYTVAAMCAIEAAPAAHEACMGQMHKAAMTLAEEAGTPCSMDDMGMKGMKHDDKDSDAPKADDHSGHH